MMLIGFGYLMAFTKSFSWSAVSYTFFMNAILVQLYLLLGAFWKRVFSTGFHHFYIEVHETEFTAALYSAASMFITLGCFIGRVGPLEVLIIGVVHSVGYSLNEALIMYKIEAFDVGGSMMIHSFGAYQGITISLILSRMVKPVSKAATNYFSNLFGFIGTLFLWMYWPSFNFGVAATTPTTKNQIISNTILSLTGSCVAAFATSAIVKAKFTMEYLLNATLAGGVVIGATAGLIFQLGGSMAIGFLSGIISTLG
jgi:ammonium transporter Rh